MKRRQSEEAPTPEEIKRSRLQPSPKESPLDQYQRRRKWRSWSVEEVSDFLRANEVPEDVARKFERHQIAGRHLLELTEEDLEKMEVFTIGLQKDILHLFKSLGEQKILSQEKVFNDPIHGHIELHPLMVQIIDTPQFQRLRSIKQLGGAYYVFPGASHNRFEHSIGVGYLAGELVETLQRKQPELGINEKDVLCVKVAGLCHDLGHGPFSHMFDGHFIREIRPDKRWKHEHASVIMFDHMIEVNNLLSEFMKHDLEENDIVFIKEQIAGPLESEMCSQLMNDWPYQGRDETKSFLYEVFSDLCLLLVALLHQIVANKRNGIDVDKWDYFARDCHCLGIPNNFDMRRYMKFARVLHVNNRRQICTRDKEVGNLYEMFHTRSSLHRRAYQHKTCNIIEHMITEALKKADEHLLLPDKDGNACVRMSEAIEDPYAYTRLTDHVIQQILMSTIPELEESRQLLQKVERRKLYKYVGQTQLPPTKSTSDTSGLAKEIVGSLSDEDADSEQKDVPRLTEGDILVDAKVKKCERTSTFIAMHIKKMYSVATKIVTFDYGKGDENPIDHVRFYRKDNPEKAVIVRKDQVSQMLPQSFRERHVRVYCKRLDQPSLQAARKYFIAWGQKQSCITPQLQGSAQGLSMDLSELDFTPYGTPYSTPMKNQQQEEEETRTPLNSEEVVKKLKFVS